MGLPSIPATSPLEGHRWGKELSDVVGCILIAGLVLGILAFRYPIINHLAWWLVVFPIVTLSGGSLAWAILIQRWDALFSIRGYEITLIASAPPIALWVYRLNRS
jgi:hypothetical protein